MTLPEKISADYTLRPSELADVLALLVEARQPTIVRGPPGAAKSQIAQQGAAVANRQYVDVRALLLGQEQFAWLCRLDHVNRAISCPSRPRATQLAHSSQT